MLYKSSGSVDEQRAGIAPSGDADTMPVGVRFSIPTVYDGKVFVVTQGELNIFRLEIDNFNSELNFQRPDFSRVRKQVG